MTDDDYLPILTNEFRAEEDTFLIQLRPWLHWDKIAFTRLTQAMAICCRLTAGQEKLDRWVAEGFWFIPTFVRDWTTHPKFPREHSAEYYEAAYERLDDLAYWFFHGETPYETKSESNRKLTTGAELD